MSIDHLEIKSNCVIWRNLELPRVNKKCISPTFNFDEFILYFEVFCSGRDAYTASGMKNGFNEAWYIALKCSDNSKSFNYVIIPHVKTAGKYVRIAPTIVNFSFTRSSLSTFLGSESHMITILFLFSLENLEEKELGKESIQCLCLGGLSEDIGRTFNSDEYADAKLVCGNKSFSVHRNILTARSEVFSSMFKHDMSEKNTGIVDIVDLDPDILEQFLRYLYSGKVEQMSVDTALELYKAADKYAVPTLKKECAFYILGNMSEDIVCAVLLLSSAAGDTEFLNGVASFAGELQGFLKSNKWEDFALKFPDVAVKVYLKCYK